LLSPDFKQDENSNEVYTPSFEHITGYKHRDQSPLSFLKQLNDVSAQKTSEPQYLRKRRKKEAELGLNCNLLDITHSISIIFNLNLHTRFPTNELITI